MDNIINTIKNISNDFSKPFTNSSSFLNKYSFEDRKNESDTVLKKYPDRIPVIIEQSINSNIPDIDKNKYLVPNDLKMGQLLWVVRKRLKLDSSTALFLFTVNGTLYTNADFVSSVYDKEHNEDGFLYLKYTSENTFG
tara:strand:+ start:448 stop:861 length:414 start_codon:yes stop_codon:yes gene_type:complete